MTKTESKKLSKLLKEKAAKRKALFTQITIDLGKKTPTYSNVETLLKSKGWSHNAAVRAAVDYMSDPSRPMTPEEQKQYTKALETIIK